MNGNTNALHPCSSHFAHGGTLHTGFQREILRRDTGHSTGAPPPQCAAMSAVPCTLSNAQGPESILQSWGDCCRTHTKTCPFNLSPGSPDPAQAKERAGVWTTGTGMGGSEEDLHKTIVSHLKFIANAYSTLVIPTQLRAANGFVQQPLGVRTILFL
mmetsp:Transcript_68201/g.120647  ORF Transcript_68201/g.120647 Transcript_68201/m.120647 type:complete len:157 (-) Transcript_68201:295-765(-)